MRGWRRAGLQLTVAVNLSARQFYREDLAQRISDIVQGRGMRAGWIELEVTETSLLHDLDAIRKVLHQLRDEGFTVAIDDFGTGYSSLTHLKHFPIDTLKIDISFIADLESDPQDAAITEAIIGLARGLGLRWSPKAWARASSSSFSKCADATASRGSGCASRCPPMRSTISCGSGQPMWRVATSRLRSLVSDVSRASRAMPERPRRDFPLGLQHQHVGHARHDRRLDVVVARGRVARHPAWRSDRPRRPSRIPARRSGSGQCSRSDSSSSTRGDSPLR